MEDFEKTSVSDTENVTENEITEEISFNVTENIVREHHKALKNGLIIVSAAAAILVFLAIAINNVLSAAISALLAYIIVRIVINAGNKARTKRAVDKLNNSTCTYRLKSECIEYYGYENGELVHFRRIKLDDVITVAKSDGLYTFVADGISYAIDREALRADSEIAKMLERIKESSSPFGLKKREKRETCKKKKHLIAPVIVICAAVILLVIALVSEPFDYYHTVDDEALKIKDEICEIIGLDIAHTDAYYYKRTMYSDDTSSFIEVENADIYMDSESGAGDFREKLLENKNWISVDSEIYKENYIRYTDSVYCDLVLIYNLSTGKYNESPTSGIYYVACYSATSHSVFIYKFSINQ